MKRTLDEISSASFEHSSIDNFLSVGFKNYLVRCLYRKLDGWSADSSRKEALCLTIIECLANELLSLSTAVGSSDLSASRLKLKSTIENLANILPHKTSMMDSLDSCTGIDLTVFKKWLQEYEENNIFNLKVYENISEHHKKLKEMDWTKAVEDNDALETYADAAVVMGSKDWVKIGTEWMHFYIQQFYFGELGVKLMQKFQKKASVDSNFPLCSKIPLPGGTKVRLLDVGSCFNPFKRWDDLDVTAIDLCPADPSVHQCDFLNITIVDKVLFDNVGDNLPGELCSESSPGSPNGGCSEIKFVKSSYNVVVMSLVLSYLPIPEQRILMIRNSRKLLSNHSSDIPGLLLLYEKDSILHSAAHYTAFLEHWKTTIAKEGFILCRYEHLIFDNKNRTHGRKAHIFIFVTDPNFIDSVCPPESKLYIKQDFADDDSETKNQNIKTKLNT